MRYLLLTYTICATYSLFEYTICANIAVLFIIFMWFIAYLYINYVTFNAYYIEIINGLFMVPLLMDTVNEYSYIWILPISLFNINEMIWFLCFYSLKCLILFI